MCCLQLKYVVFRAMVYVAYSPIMLFSLKWSVVRMMCTWLKHVIMVSCFWGIYAFEK